MSNPAPVVTPPVSGFSVPKSSGGQRTLWIDIARGMCIMLVVLGHCSEWYAAKLLTVHNDLWDYLGIGLRPLRLPLFFLISGMLAASKMHRPLSALADKTIGLYLLYCLWTAIYCVKLAIPAGRDYLPYPEVWQIIGIFALPTILWFIWTLPAYFLIAWSAQRFLGQKSIYLLGPLFLLAVAAPALNEPYADMLGTPLFMVYVYGFASNLLWFFVGIKGRDLILAIANYKSPIALLAALASGTAALVLAWYVKNPLVQVLCVAPILWAAISLLSRISPGAWLGQQVAAVGRDTLPIYVMHTTILTGMTFLISLFHIRDWMDFGYWPRLIFLPILISLGLVYGCIIGGRILRHMGLGFMVSPIVPRIPAKWANRFRRQGAGA